MMDLLEKSHFVSDAVEQSANAMETGQLDLIFVTIPELISMCRYVNESTPIARLNMP